MDAREFERLVREGRLEAAVDLCDGELLPGLDAEWVYEARESHRHRLGDVLDRLASDAEATGALKDAIRISRRRVALDPLSEDAHRELIRRLIAAGRSPAARVAFDDLARRLRAELQVAPVEGDPSPARGHSLARRRSRDRRRRDAAAASPAVARRERTRSSVVRTRSGWLRAQWSEARDGSGRLAVIAGDPGIGKTRLASEFARAAHGDGAAVLLGRCHEEPLVPYQPFVEAFGRLRRGSVAGGAAAANSTRPAASSRDSFPSSPGDSRIWPMPVGADPEGQRFRLFEAAGCAGRERVAIVAGRAAA